VLVLLRRLGRFRPALIGWALTAVVGLDLVSVLRQYWAFSPSASQLYRSDAVVEQVKRSPEPGRVLVFGDPSRIAPGDPFFGGQGIGVGTGLMVNGVRSITGYHGNELGRYQRLGGVSDTSGYQNILSPAFWRLMNVRWLYTNADPGDSAFRKVAGPVANAAGTQVSLYEVPGDNPFAWVTPGAAKAPDETALNVLLDQRFDPRRITILDTSVKVVAQAPQTLPEPLRLPVHTSGYAPGRFTLELARPAPQGSWLVVSENYFPGWTARADGREVPVHRADFVLMGVELPAGTRRLDFSFADPAYGPGKATTLVATALAVLLAALGLAVDRRRKAHG
jgi:hypothetical protein